MMDCLVCDGFIPQGKAFSFVLYFPICSEKCQKEWDDLTFVEQQRYLECVSNLNALRE